MFEPIHKQKMNTWRRIVKVAKTLTLVSHPDVQRPTFILKDKKQIQSYIHGFEVFM